MLPDGNDHNDAMEEFKKVIEQRKMVGPTSPSKPATHFRKAERHLSLLDTLTSLLMDWHNNPSASYIEFTQFWKEADVNDFLYHYNSKNQTLLYVACRSGVLEVIKVFLSIEGVPLGGPQQLFNSSTPLHGANWGGHTEIVAMLLYQGAKPEKNVCKEGRFYPREEENRKLPPEKLSTLRNIWKTYHASGKEAMLEFCPAGWSPTQQNDVRRSSLWMSTKAAKQKAQSKKPISVALYRSFTTTPKGSSFQSGQPLDNNISQSSLKSPFSKVEEEDDDITLPIAKEPISLSNNKYTANIDFPLEESIESSLPSLPEFPPLPTGPLKAESSPLVTIVRSELSLNEPKIETNDLKTSDSLLSIEKEKQQLIDLLAEQLRANNIEKFSLDGLDPADINRMDSTGCTLLYIACRKGIVAAVKKLLEFEGIEVGGPQEWRYKSTPLHGASWGGYPEIIAMLLSCGATPEVNNGPDGNKLPQNELNKENPSFVYAITAKIWMIFAEEGRDGVSQFCPPNWEIPKRFKVPSMKASQGSNSEKSKIAEVPASQLTEDGEIEMVDMATKPINTSTEETIPPQIEKPETKKTLDITPEGITSILQNYDKWRCNNTEVVKITSYDTQTDTISFSAMPDDIDEASKQMYRLWREWGFIVALCNWKKLPEGGQVQLQFTDEGITGVPINRLYFVYIGAGPKGPIRIKSISSNGDWTHNPTQFFPRTLEIELEEAPQETSILLDIVKSWFKTYKASVHITVKKENNNTSLLVTETMEEFPEIVDEIFVPPEYQKCNYIFIKSGTPLTLFDATTNCILEKTLSRKKREVSIVPVGRTTPISFNFDLMEYTVYSKRNVGNHFPFRIAKRVTQWYYRDEAGALLLFDEKSNYEILMNIRKNSKFNVMIGKQQFEINPSSMTMVNIRNGFVSQIMSEFDIKQALGWLEQLVGSVRWGGAEWNEDSFNESLIIKEIPPSSVEFINVEKTFSLSMTSNDKTGKPISIIDKIYKVENYVLRQHWIHEIKMLQLKNKSAPMTKLLFHGSDDLPPHQICSNAKGWTTNYASDANPWGRGHLFSQKASYCANYAYKKDEHTRVLMLAEVIIGDSIYSEMKKMREPPEKEPGVRYDSVHCYHRDAWVWITYDSKRGYPRYIIEYTPKK